MGRLTREPDVRYSQNADGSMAVARYTLAVDRRRARNNNDEQSADFISCVAFGRAGEFAEKYLHQGTKIVVTGRIQTGSYTNKDGQRVYTTDVVVEEQEFVAERVKSRIDGLLEEADNYTRIMNEDYESFFMDHAEDMYKVQLELSEYRKLKAVVNSGSLEDIRSYLVNKVNNITNTLLGEKLRLNTTSATTQLAHILELELIRDLRGKFIMFLDFIGKDENVAG